MDQLQISPQADAALQRLQDTNLTPMEEALFKAWTKANQIEDPDAPDDSFDYRGVWKETNGLVLPPGELKKKAEAQNLSNTLQKALQERMVERIKELTGKQEDFQQAQFDAERQDITHKQNMEQGDQDFRMAPFNLKMKEHDTKGKELGIEQKKLGLEQSRLGLDQAKLGNQGKELDLISSLLGAQAPTQPVSK